MTQTSGELLQFHPKEPTLEKSESKYEKFLYKQIHLNMSAK